MTLRDAIAALISALRSIYDAGEARAIAMLVMEKISSTPYPQLNKEPGRELNQGEIRLLDQFRDRLLTGEPVQYVLEEAWFGGFRFYVDKHVLIPRPETEELVEWMIADHRSNTGPLAVLDIGTGSGCIPITIKKKLPRAEVWSCDISEDALEVARRNASDLGAGIHFLQLDFLDPQRREQLSKFDIVISNPPYVPDADKTQMHPNVLGFEPHAALFAPGNDALVFYRAIAAFGRTSLKPGGMVYVELHESGSDAVTGLFRQNGYLTELRQDMQGKMRMLKAHLNT